MSGTETGVGLRSTRGPILLAVMVATALVAIDATILSTAVPAITADVGGFSSFAWLFSVYLLAQSVTVPIYSKLADTIGRKPVILFGIAVFGVGSVLCGLAWSMPALIAFRAVQGIGAGAVLPVTMTVMGDIYTIRERAKVQGYVASVWAVASVVGPTLGGVFAQLDAWRGIFWVNVPLCLLAGWLLARNFSERVERRPQQIDVLGAALLAVGLTLVLLGTLEGGNAWAWDSPASVAVFAVGAALLFAFVVVERRAAAPIMPGWVATRPVVRTTSLVGLGVGAGLIGLTAFVPTYLQVSLGLEPVVAGLGLATLTIGWPIAATLSGRIYLRIGFRSTSIIGGALVVLGAAGLVAWGGSPSFVTVAVCCFVIGLGFGLSAVPTLVLAQSSVDWSERGVVTGVNMLTRSLGQAAGAAVLGAVANGVIAGRDETDPSVLVPATHAVFVGVLVVAVGLLVAALALPRSPALAAGSNEPEPDVRS